jgi:FtsH-binding integral membrane protein
MHPETKNLHHAVRDGVTRAVAAIGLAGIALIHLLDAPSKFSETPYMGWLYVGLMIASLATAFALVRGSWSPAWGAALVLPACAIVGYVLTRTVGLPQAHGDVGNWKEPLGMASLLVEGSLVAVAGHVLVERALGRAPARARFQSVTA